MTRPGRRRGGDQLAVAVDMDQGGADVVEPAECLESDVAGMADEHEPAELGDDAVVAAGAALAADAVVDDQVSAVNVELEPVAVSDA
jgi:hypothetical protein